MSSREHVGESELVKLGSHHVLEIVGNVLAVSVSMDGCLFVLVQPAMINGALRESWSKPVTGDTC